MLFIDPDIATYPMENYKIYIYIYKMGNRQRPIYWNPIKRGGNKMNKRRERRREISKPFLPFFNLSNFSLDKERGVYSVPNFCFLPFPLLFLPLPLPFTLHYFFLSSSLLYSPPPEECLPG